MVFLGKTGAVKLSASRVNDFIQIDGEQSGFYGYKLDSLSGSNGVFVEWQATQEGLTLTNDAFGLFPLFYVANKDSVSLSSSITDLTKNSDCSQLDDAAIALFLRTGNYIGDTTPFLKIKVLPPGSTLTFDKQGFVLRQTKIAPDSNATVSLSEAKDIYGDLFHQSIRKFQNITDTKIGVPLSGGRDSRHILFELLASGMPPSSCITMKHQPPKPDEDAAIAGEVCNFLGIEHCVLEQDRSLLQMEREKNRLTNLCSLDHSWILPLSRQLSTDGFDAIFDGIAGDVLSAGLFLTESRLNLFRNERFDQLADEMLGDEGYLPKLLTEPFYKRFDRELAADLLIEELKQHVDTQNPVGQFFLWNRTRRNIGLSGWGILSQNTQVFAPYLDHDLYRFLASLPAEYFLDHSFHQDTISRCYPKYEHLAYEAKNVAAKKGNRLSVCQNAAELSFHFRRLLKAESMCRPSFIYPRALKSLASVDYYSQSKSLFQTAIYLSDLLDA